MKYSIFFLVFLLVGCNTINVKNSREKLLIYEAKGYSVLVNDSLIKLREVYLDQEKIKHIKLNKPSKCILLTRKENKLNLVSLSVLTEPEESSKLVSIDGYLISDKEINSTKIEMSSIKLLTILKDSSILHGRNFKKIIIISTKNNDR